MRRLLPARHTDRLDTSGTIQSIQLTNLLARRCWYPLGGKTTASGDDKFILSSDGAAGSKGWKHPPDTAVNSTNPWWGQHPVCLIFHSATNSGLLKWR